MKNNRYIGALIAVLITLGCIIWLYGTEYKYPNTEEGRALAVQEYVPYEHTRVHAWQFFEDRLLIYYTAEENETIHGVVQLRKGINNRYQILSANYSNIRYTAGINDLRINLQGLEPNYFVLAGRADEKIHTVKLEYSIINSDRPKVILVEKVYDMKEDFCYIVEEKELIQSLGIEPLEYDILFLDAIKIYDEDNNDITNQYAKASLSGGGMKGKAELFVLYIYIGVIALIGSIVTAFILTKK